MKGVIRRKSKVKYKSFEPADCRICAIKKREYPVAITLGKICSF